MELYSLKMRASRREDGTENHISGAEKIVGEDSLVACGEALVKRALQHAKGKPDFINLKMESLVQGDILYLDSLPVRTIQVDNYQEGLRELAAILEKMGLTNGTKIMEKLNETYNMRGAVLLYLDMANDRQVKDYTKQMIEEYGTGSGGSRLTTGTTVLHTQLENLLARFKGTEAALVFNTGYMANVGTISALCAKGDIIFSDELNHASIIDGCRLSGAKIVVYRHNDMADLEEKVKANPCSQGLIVSDAVFSMDGDIVNLPQLLAIAEKYGLLSMIDEAHATGVIGVRGVGTAEYYHLPKKPDILMGTLSKAIGSEGGFVCGKQLLIEYLKNKARSFIFSTALSPAVLTSSLKALELIMNEPQRVQALQENVRCFCQFLKEFGIQADSPTAIIPIIIGDEQKTLAIGKDLLEQGYFVSAIRYPSVKKGSARLRVTLMASHTKEELKAAAKAIGETVNKYRAGKAFNKYGELKEL